MSSSDVSAPTDPSALAAALGSPEDHIVDFDGTISPIVDHPDLASPVAGAVAAVAALSHQTTVVILSGRPVADLRRRFGELDGVVYAGGHGAEVQLPDGEVTTFADVDEVATPLDDLEAVLEPLIGDAHGWYIERKPTSLAVHHRLAEQHDIDALLPRIQALMEHHAEQPPGFSVLNGKAVVELRPVTATKGNALRWLAARTPQLRPLVVGDDVTDEDAFEAARDAGGRAVLVADEPRDTHATDRLADPDAVAAFLTAFGRREP